MTHETMLTIETICSVIAALGVIIGGIYTLGIQRGQLKGLVADMQLIKNHLFPAQVQPAAHVAPDLSGSQMDLAHSHVRRNR